MVSAPSRESSRTGAYPPAVALQKRKWAGRCGALYAATLPPESAVARVRQHAQATTHRLVILAGDSGKMARFADEAMGDTSTGAMCWRKICKSSSHTTRSPPGRWPLSKRERSRAKSHTRRLRGRWRSADATRLREPSPAVRETGRMTLLRAPQRDAANRNGLRPARPGSGVQGWNGLAFITTAPIVAPGLRRLASLAQYWEIPRGVFSISSTFFVCATGQKPHWRETFAVTGRVWRNRWKWPFSRARFCTSLNRRALRFRPRQRSSIASHLMTLAAKPAQPTNASPAQAVTKKALPRCPSLTDLPPAAWIAARLAGRGTSTVRRSLHWLSNIDRVLMPPDGKPLRYSPRSSAHRAITLLRRPICSRSPLRWIARLHKYRRITFLPTPPGEPVMITSPALNAVNVLI